MAIAYVYWYCGLDLLDAYARVTSIRPCGPRMDAIRAATAGECVMMSVGCVGGVNLGVGDVI